MTICRKGINMEIRRDRYIKNLKDRRENGLVKVITGVRRCGKSYLLNKLFYDELIAEGIKDKQIIRFAFDSADDLALIGEDLIELSKEDRLVDPGKFVEYIKKITPGKNMYYLLLDEIQLLGNFEAVINGYLRKLNMDVYVTGSNARLLSSDIITEFAGRGDEVHMQSSACPAED